MKQYQKEQQGVVGRDPVQGCDELTTVTLRNPVTSESQEVPVRRVGRVPRELIRRVIAEDREALELLAPHDGASTDR